MINDYLLEVWRVFLELSPALIAGTLIAGALHVLLPPSLIHRQMSKPGFGSNMRAALIGVPMPLCSCGVVPTALGLKREGASNGATTSFLISTPQTGVDSILVSASFLGWPFAIFKVFAAFITGLIGGLLADKVAPAPPTRPPTDNPSEPRFSRPRWLEALHYAVYDMFAAIDQWLLIGVLVAAAITVAVPDNFFTQLSWAQGITGMLLMLAIATPLYVCTTASVPIAASFIAAGMPLGTALVFLMAGPATNIATLGAVYRVLGGRLLAVYLGTVIVMSIVFGLGFDFVLDQASTPTHAHEHGAATLNRVSALLVIALILYLNLRRLKQRWMPTPKIEEKDVDAKLNVEGMSCPHCVASVKRSLEGVPGVELAEPDLASGIVTIHGDGFEISALKSAVESAGYKVLDES
ncbi:MAG: permease [Gammaproteobacteria bacterium]|nr:permease [Gammaproteobacteria bacterium]MCP5136095.1 permease [Gammaproteobacteria bacterium]